jgi:DNA-binding GntR family transcriptional regulator
MDKEAKAGDIHRYYPNNLRFHDLLVAYAGNNRLAEIYRRITRELHLFRLQGLYAGGAVPSNVEHWNILKAIQSGSAERAAAAMRTHIDGARARMLKAAAVSSALHAPRACAADSITVSPAICFSHLRSILIAAKASMML